jgi:replicative DNA helicase
MKDVKIEQRVLGMAFFQDDAQKIVARLNKWDFTNRYNKMIFSYIRDLVNEGHKILKDDKKEEIEKRLLQENIPEEDIDWIRTEILENHTSTLDEDILKLKEYSIRRNIQTDIEGGKPLKEISEYLQDKIGSFTIDQIAQVEPVDWDRLANVSGEGPRGFLPKIADFEDTYHGINGLSILVGESEAGKSLFALALAKDFIEQGIPCLYYSLEMDRDSIEKRFMTMVLYNHYEKEIWDNTAKFIEKHREDLDQYGQYLFVRDSINLEDIIAEIDAVRIATGLNQIFVVVDFLQLIYNVRGNSQKEQLDYILNSLRAAHNEASIGGKIAMLAITQITKETSKNLEYTKDEQDLKKILFTGGMGSAQIHYAADLYFAILKNESTFETKLICLKNRHGGNKFEEITLKFKPRGLRYE